MTAPQPPENSPVDDTVARSLDQISVHLQQLGAQLRAATAPPPQPAPPSAAAPPPPPPPFAMYPGGPQPGFAPVPWSPPVWRPGFAPRTPQTPPQTPPQAPLQTPPLDDPAPTPGLWDRLGRDGAGSRVLAWIGGGVTLAGVVLLLVLAVQRGWLGPEARVVAGGVLGALLAAIGTRLHRTPGSVVGALAVTATGTAVAYLDVVAATALYHFLPAWAGLAAGLAIAAPGLTLAARWRSQLFAAFVVAGAALSAPFVTMHVDGLLTAFLLVLQLAAAPVQLRRRWVAVALVAAVPPTVAASLDLALHHGSVRAAAFAAVVAVVQLGLATSVARTRPDDDASLALALLAPLPVLLLAADGLPRYTAVGLLLAVAAAFAGLVVAHLGAKLPLPGAFVTAAAGGGAAVLFEATVLALRGDVRTVGLLGVGLLFAALAGRIRHAAALWISLAFAAAGVLLTLARTVTPRGLALAPTGAVARADVITVGATSALLAGTAIAIGWALTRLRPAVGTPTLHACWSVVAPVVLYGATGVGVAIGLVVAPDAGGFRAGHVIVTLSWTVAAFVLLVRHHGSTPLRIVALALVAAAVAKLVLFDLASLSGLARVLAFLGAGLILLAAGERYAKRVGARTA